MRVTLPYDKSWEALEWAKKNCPSYVTNSSANFATIGPDEWPVISYYFNEEKDAVAFMLRWK